MIVLDTIPVAIDPDDVFSRLHLDRAGPYAEEVTTIIDRAAAVARPRAAYGIAAVECENDAVVRLVPEEASASPRRFTSKVLRSNLDGVERAFPYVVTCGVELDAIPVSKNDMFAEFCRDVVKEVVLWAGVVGLYEHLTKTYELRSIASMNPGSGGLAVWSVEQQRELFALLGDVESATGVRLTESCLMVPNKSVSGVFFPDETGFENCHVCRQRDCSHRRAPFDKRRWQSFLEEPAA